MKYKLTLLLLLALSTKSFSETYTFGGYESIVVTVFGESESSVAYAPSFQGPVLPSDPDAWIDFFRIHCDLNYSSVDEMDEANIMCPNKGINDSNFPSVAGLTKTGGNLYFQDNQLTSLDSLSLLKSVGSRLSLYNNNLSNVDGLWRLETVGAHLYLHNNNLANVDGLSYLTSVGGNLYLQNNNLQNVNALLSLETIGKGLDLRFNTNLQDLSGINNLTSMGWEARFDDRSYTVKMESTSFLCQVGNEAKIIGTEKANVCES
jgi:hypothetical protein